MPPNSVNSAAIAGAARLLLLLTARPTLARSLAIGPLEMSRRWLLTIFSGAWLSALYVIAYSMKSPSGYLSLRARHLVARRVDPATPLHVALADPATPLHVAPADRAKQSEPKPRGHQALRVPKTN